MLKAYKYRIYPNSEQRIQIAKTFGCCRFVYNQTLAYRKEIYEKEKKSVSKTDCNNYCNRELKKDYEWLKEIDKFALTNAIYNMDAAYQKFFKEHAGYPKFKSKHDNHKSYTTNFTNGNIAVDFETGKIKLPKLKAVKARLHREYSGQIKSATVSQVSSEKYYVSILVETEHKELAHTNHNIGIDLGIKDLCITSDGKVYENLKIIKKYEKQLVKLQRQLSHKGKRSKNYYKTKKKIVLWSSFFVTLVAKKIVLINLCCRPCFIWGSITIITVWTNMIIINVCKFFYLLIECFLCCKLIQICAFILQGIEITLHRCIVVRISCFAHALCHIYRFAEFGKCFGRIL